MPVSRRFVRPRALVVALLLVACGTEETAVDRYVMRGETMATTYAVTMVGDQIDEEQLPALQETIDAVLEGINDRMSTYQDDSELSSLNRQPAEAPLTLSDALFGVIAQALAISIATGGAYDVTVGPLVNAWGFGPETGGEAPSGEALAQLRDRVGVDKLTVEGSTREVTKAHDGVYVDLSSIAKGYAVDEVARTLIDAGITNFLVEVGGEMRASGVRGDGQRWRVGIERPSTSLRAAHRFVSLADQALATSGDYRNYREVDGRRVSHILDPRSGAPIVHRTASASVLADTCAAADAWATALMVLSPTEGLRRAEEHGLGAMLLVRNDDGEFDEVSNATWERLTGDER